MGEGEGVARGGEGAFERESAQASACRIRLPRRLAPDAADLAPISRRLGPLSVVSLWRYGRRVA